MKKLAAMILAVVMTMALALPAFAADDKNDASSTTQSTKYTTTSKGLEIKLTVKEAATVTFNPYKMSIEVNGETTNGQVISPAVFITSQTKIPLTINAAVTGSVPTPESGKTADDYVAFATKSTASTTGKKQAFVYWEIMKANDAETEPKWTDLDKVSAGLASDASDDAKKAGNISSIIVLKTEKVEKKGVYTMPAAGDDPVYAAFHLAGDAVVNPASSSNPNATWNEKDAFGATVVLTFLPAAS